MKTPRNVLALSIATFLSDISTKIIRPLIPFFIIYLGGSGISVGLVSGVSESIVSLTKIVSGHVADRIKNKRRLVGVGYFVSSASKLMFAFASSWPHVLIFRSSERFGKGVRAAPIDVILSKYSQKEKRGRNFGIHRAFASGGSVLGSFLALLLFYYLGMGFQQIFMIAGVLAFLSIVPIFGIKEHVIPEKKIEFRKGIRELSRPLKILIVSSAVFALGNFGYMFFVLRSQQAFPKELEIAMPIVLYAVFQIAGAVSAYPVGKYSDKIGQKRILLLVYALYFVTTFGFIYLKSVFFLVLLFVIFGIVYTLTNTMQRTFVSNSSSEKYNGTSFGIYHAIVGIMALPSGIIAGYLWDISQEYTFYFGAIATIIAFIVLLFVREKNNSLI